LNQDNASYCCYGDKFEISSQDEEVEDEEIEAANTSEVKGFIQQYGIDIRLDSEFKDQLAEELFKEVQSCVEDSMYLYSCIGFSKTNIYFESEERQWQFSLMGDGMVGDAIEEDNIALEKNLSANAPHFNKIRKELENIFNTSTTVSCIPVG